MLRLAIAFILALAATAANAENSSPDNRKLRPLPARIEHSRSCLMPDCPVMASENARTLAIVTPALAPSSCCQKQVSLNASVEALGAAPLETAPSLFGMPCRLP